MAFRINDDMRSALCNAGIGRIAGTHGESGTGRLSIYTGNQPISAATNGTGALLCVISNIAWSAATGGSSVLCSTTGYAGTAILTGSAGWGRLERNAGTGGTFRIDGDIGTSGTNVFSINTVPINEGAVITLMSADIYLM
jgi:hypothetical protein